MISVYITAKDSTEAKRISRHLLEKKLIACANIFPIQSMYWWDGKIVESGEYAIIAKTTEEKFPGIEREVKKVHSYDVPCIVSWKVQDVHAPYREWVEKETA